MLSPSDILLDGIPIRTTANFKIPSDCKISLPHGTRIQNNHNHENLEVGTEPILVELIPDPCVIAAPTAPTIPICGF